MSKRIGLPDYFVSPILSVWAFEETGEAIEWKDYQSTAIMLPHLQILCRALANQLKGLPPLTAILFIVDALSKGWTPELATERVSQLITTAGNVRIRDAMLAQIVSMLTSLQKLDAGLRHGVRTQEAILGELFEQIPRDWLTSERETTLTLDWMEKIIGDRSGLIQTRLLGEAHAASRALTTLDFVSMHALDGQSLQLRLRSGLDTLPNTESLEILERFPLAALVKTMATSSDELGAVARMAQSVSATLSLPRLPSDPDVLPIGGVSDVTNRGQPDRLLMSELALDNDLLIARIANGQALYLRREQPPQPEPKHRCVIVESGVRTWGAMRLYSAAFALGTCIAQERRGGELVDVVTVAGDRAWLEDFTNRDGIERFYERLSPAVHPAQSLMDLTQHKSIDIDLESQPILILSEATDRDPEFRRLTRDFPKPHLLARVEQAGWVELLQRGSLGDAGLQRMRLTEPSPAPKSKTVAHESLPLFLLQSPSPLRFSVHPSGLSVQAYDDGFQDGCWVLTHDRRAVLLDDRRLGAIEAGYIPGGRILASFTPNRSIWQLVIESMSHKTQVPVHLLVDVHVSRGVTVSEIRLRDEIASNVTYCFDRGHLIRVGKHITYLDSRTGVILASTECTRRHLGSDLFTDENEVYVASRVGESIRWQRLGKIPSGAGSAARFKHGIPVVYAQDLSWMATLDGGALRIQQTTASATTAYPHTVVRVNATATHMLVALKGITTNSSYRCRDDEERLFSLSLSEPRASFLGKSTPAAIAAFEINKQKFSYLNNNVRTHLQSMSFDDDTVFLHTTHSRLAIRVHNSSDVHGFTCLSDGRTPMSPNRYYCEKPLPRAGGQYCKWKLRPINLPNGQAWLDSRGLLHLRASDGSELSLTLCQGLLAGWHSCGTIFGPQYFTAAKPGYTNATPEMFRWLVNFARDQQHALK